MSDTNRAQLAYVKETTFGSVPAGPPDLKVLRYTRESLGTDTDTKVSEEIRSDRQQADVVRTGLRGAGEMGFELSQDSYDDWMEAALLSAPWTAAQAACTGATNVQVIAASNRFQIATSWTNQPAVGDWVKVAGFATAVNNGYFKVAASTSTQIDVTEVGVLQTEAAGPAITIGIGAKILNGTTFSSWYVEREYKDLSNEFVGLHGFCIDGFNLNVPVDGFVNGSFVFLGKREQSYAATNGDGSPTAAPSTDVFNSIDNVPKMLEANAAFKATAFTLALRNNLRARMEIGTLGAASIGTGEIALSGTLQAYYQTKALFDKYVNFVQTSLAIVISLGTEAYVVDLPKVKLGGARRVAGGKNADIIADLQWIATRHATEDKTIRISRWT